jgi:ribose 5-phosphate isomerase B
MKIVIGTDHRGYSHKEYIMGALPNYEWIDVGTFSDERTDYPPFAHKAVELIVSQTVEYGVLLCGTGGGMAIAANRYSSIYAVVAWNTLIAQQAKAEDNCNVLVLPADFLSEQKSVECIYVWLSTYFKHDRYEKRLLMIDDNAYTFD